MKLRKFIPPISILLFLALVLAGSYYGRKALLEKTMANALALEDGPTIRNLLRSWPAPVNVVGTVEGSGRAAGIRLPITPLVWAVRNRDLDSVKLCTAAHADLNLRAWLDETPLDIAVGLGEEDIVSALIAAGADVRAKSGSGLTQLHVAADLGYTDIAKLLIAAGADLNAKDEECMTPLHLAAARDQKEMVRLLISKGCDINLKGPGGITALGIALEERNMTVAEILRDAGAKE